ncbi:hypothetical protein PHYPSEUDO_002073 [Phytophthora pseudosyringae]|uniref:Uncharacterized protein n=1 Tax=Phytophthora pseudosyringae TaxID=221518 RepID=A0A8T1V587_9STRA|nr:hypothetical protein PHYPSEUDO_002073 [Phytophthora pseudosyringae]
MQTQQTDASSSYVPGSIAPPACGPEGGATSVCRQRLHTDYAAPSGSNTKEAVGSAAEPSWSSLPLLPISTRFGTAARSLRADSSRPSWRFITSLPSFERGLHGGGGGTSAQAVADRIPNLMVFLLLPRQLVIS